MKRIIAKIALIAGRRAVSADAHDIIYALKSRRDTREREARFIRAVPCNSLGLPVRVKSDVQHIYTRARTHTHIRARSLLNVDKSESIMIRGRQKCRHTSIATLSAPLPVGMHAGHVERSG